MQSSNMVDPASVKRKLLALKTDVQQTITQIDSSTGPVELDQNRVGRLSRMDAMQGQALARASSQRQIELLRRIDATLIRLDRGDYGRCLDCDELIPSARLEVDWTTTHCVACASAMEA